MRNLIVVLSGGISNEREISFLTGKACANALKKKGYKVKELDPQGLFVDKLKKLKHVVALLKILKIKKLGNSFKIQDVRACK